MKTSVFAFLVTFAFFCNAQSWPAWVTEVQKSDEYLIAVGIGESRLAAKQAALADITTQLSIDINTRQTQTLTKKDNTASRFFKQETTLNSLPFTLAGIEELHFVKQGNAFALKMGVKKSVLVATLKSDLSALSYLVPPAKDAEKRFVWALQNSHKLNLAVKKLAVLEHLAGLQQSIQSTLKHLLNEQSKALNAISCDVIGAFDVSEIKSALNDALPHSGDTQLWMRPQLRWQYAQNNNQHSAKATLTLALTQSSSPFRVLLQHDLHAQDSATTLENAKQKVIKNLVQQLKAPVSQWLFDL
jgi:hypothetical protein